MLVSRLWARFGAGGISVGRSYQAALLEGFMMLFPLHDRGDDLEEDFYREIRRRAAAHGRDKTQAQLESQMELPFSELSMLSDPEFMLLSLREMRRWYTEEAEALEFNSNLPKEAVTMLWLLCEIAYLEISHPRLSFMSFDKESICREGRERTDLVSKNEERLREFAELKFSPWKDFSMDWKRPQKARPRE